MVESYNPFEDADAAGSAKEGAGESDEKFRDRWKKNQAAIKKIRQQEGKKQKQDSTLAHIIVQFLSDPRFTRFFLLISRIVARNVPSDLILAILSLIHKESAHAIEEKKLELPEGDVAKTEKEDSFPAHLKANISRWTQNITAVATAEPHRTLETALDHDWKLDMNLPELCAAVLQQFFSFQKEDVPPIENLRGFAEGFWKRLVAQLEQQVHSQGALQGAVDEDFEEDLMQEAA